MSILKGKKTYIVSSLVTLLVVAKSMGYVKMSPEQWEAIFTLLGAGGLAAVRSALSGR